MAIQNTPVFAVICKTASATVKVECNAGPTDILGNPPATEWIDVSAGGIGMVNGDVLAKRCPPGMPFWRTNIIAISGGGSVQSYFPVTPVCPAAYPSTNAVTSEF
jgi:hypothetical protein